MNNETKKTYNRLINEKSPYLLQHAENPVDWYPWGEEAFEKARKENKPIFLSIGYSTCHWCHVMEKESFEDAEVAKLMNETFVSIKVDREERPEIDKLYMSVCQMITGSGGWPLTIIMDANKHPFTAGTYFPKESQYGRIGMLDLIPKIKDLWENHRERLDSSAQEVVDLLKESEITPGESFTKDILDEAFKEASLLFDEKYGGFKGAPKFPTPHKLMFLLRYWYRTGNPKALEIVEKTLQAMRYGGLYDHVGFGFHRYSTDSQWLLPHFEKMLYDQALLAIAYIEAFQVTKNNFYKEVAEEIFTYVLRDMTSQEGGFFSAEDADSEGEEGLFYTWTMDEISKTLDNKEAEFFFELFNFDEDGNFYDQATRQKTGRNIPYITKSLEKFVRNKNITLEEIQEKATLIQNKLFTIREKRIHPHKDDKILTDWNGLMIVALALGGRIFENKTYINAAEKAANFILNNLVSSKNRLYHRYRIGDAGINGFVDDYVFFIWGLLELYESTFKENYLKNAIEFNESLINHFWDENKGGLFFSPNDGEEILVRRKEIYDGAIPSGNSIAALNFLKISRITANLELEDKASKIFSTFSLVVEQALIAHSMLMSALEYIFGNAFEVVIVGDLSRKDTNEMLFSLRQEFIPNKVVLFVPMNSQSDEILSITDFVQYKESIEGKATAHVCINRFCKFPTADKEKMLELLNISEK